jgi:hypothetical protein
MSDTSGYDTPTVNPVDAAHQAAAANAPESAPARTPPDGDEILKERAKTLYDELKPQAANLERDYVLNRTPHDLADAMRELVDGDMPYKEEPQLRLGPPSDPLTENAVGQYAAQRAAAEAAEGERDAMREELKSRGPGSEQPPNSSTGGGGYPTAQPGLPPPQPQA